MGKNIDQLQVATTPEVVGSVKIPAWVVGATKSLTIDQIVSLAGGGGGGGIQSVVAGTNVTVDNTDPLNPVVSATGGGGGVVPITVDTTKNVPADFATLNLALDWAKQQVVTNGATVTIEVANTETITEGIDLSGIYAPWLSIVFGGAGVAVDGTTFTPHPLFGTKIFFFSLHTVVGSVYGTLLPTNVSDVMLVTSYFSDMEFGNPLLAARFNAGSGWMAGFDISVGECRLLGVDAASVDYVLSANANGAVHVENNSVLSGGTSTTAAVRTNGGDISFLSTSVTGTYRALEASSGSIKLSSSNVTGDIYAGAGGVIDGSLSTLATPANAITSGHILYSSGGGVISLNVDYDITVSAPNLAANLAHADYAGEVKVIAPAINGVSSGKVGDVATAGKVTVVCAGKDTAFTGGYSQAVNVQTSNGLIVA